ncbi:MAG TPA: amidase [Solirubrobacteraceae bacterium]|jgi:amidase
MSDSDLMFRPAVELAGIVRSGELSARELVEASLRRIELLNPQVNAFVEIDAERALQTASEIARGDERPFAGVPIAIKNNRPVAGLRYTLGCELMADHVVSIDHGVVTRLRNAGFVIVGTTTLPEHGILPTSEARIFGPTRNPWDLQRSSGGSSGGSAAAVASGMVPVAHGNDGGGSIRIPAACCGLVGLKPQRGRITSAPELGESLLVCDGVLSHTVADTAAILDVLEGYEPGDATWAPPPSEPFAAAAGRWPVAERLRPLRIAMTTQPPLPEVSLDPLCAQAVTDTAAILRELGHEVEEVDPPWQIEGLSDVFGAVFSSHIALSIAFSAMVTGKLPPTAEDMEPLSWAIHSMVSKMGAVEQLALTVQLQAIARQLVAFLEPYDALLTPALAERPAPLGMLDACAPEPMRTFTRSGLYTPFTPLFNATGQPGISLPLFHGEDGLPLAVQLVGKPACEDILLALASEIEAAHPWHGRRPPPSEAVSSVSVSYGDNGGRDGEH